MSKKRPVMSKISGLLLFGATGQRETAGERERVMVRQKHRQKEEKEGRENVKTSNLMLSRCGVNEVMLLYSSCLLYSFQIRVTCSLCRGFFWGGVEIWA